MRQTPLSTSWPSPASTATPMTRACRTRRTTRCKVALVKHRQTARLSKSWLATSSCARDLTSSRSLSSSRVVSPTRPNSTPMISVRRGLERWCQAVMRLSTCTLPNTKNRCCKSQSTRLSIRRRVTSAPENTSSSRSSSQTSNNSALNLTSSMQSRTTMASRRRNRTSRTQASSPTK